MLAKKYRLSREKEIQKVLNKGYITFGPFFNIKYLKNNNNYPRFCIIIPNKISKIAVIRNRTKRRLRALIFKYLDQFNPNFDYVFLAKPAITIKKSSELEKSLLKILK